MSSPSNSQRTAICHQSGPMLVMAGPGSGKTFVMIQRLLYLIHEKNISPNQILLISFSKAAALELQERFYKESKGSKAAVTFATFHAFFFHILKEIYHYRIQDIIQEKEKRDLLRIILSDPQYDRNSEERSNLSKSRMEEKIEELLQKISYYKNRTKKELENTKDRIFISIFQEYNRLMHEKHKLDFDDMGLLCLELFQRDEPVLKKYQEKYKYIMIDEFQDINEIQFRVIYLLMKKYRNLFVVGDDDQAIYSFRGASPKFMLEFAQFYPDTKKVLLETNFRCSAPIVEKSLQVINENTLRIKKEIKAFHSLGQGVAIRSFESPFQEYEYIAETIEQLKAQQLPYKDICCIFRTNSHILPLAEFLARKKIPFSMKEKSSSIFRHFIAKDIYHYLKFFYGGKKREDFLAIMNKPLRYLSRNACSREIILWQDLLEYYQHRGYMKEVVEELILLEKWFFQLDFFGAVYYLRKAGGYETYLKEQAKAQNLEWRELEDILEFIHHSLKNISSLEQWEERIEEYEERLKRSKEEKNGVSLMTMHACKGLEFPVVFLPDCNEGKVPHNKAATKEEIEEERRMFYVAMTRAKERLEILYLKNEKKEYLQKSRFINSIT